MARDRQRAKQRQAQRRARRQAQQGAGRPEAKPPATDGSQARAAERELTDPTVVEPSPAVDEELAVGAPPEEEGRSDLAIRDEPELDEELAGAEVEEEEELEEEELEEDEELAHDALEAGALEEVEGVEPEEPEAAYAPRGRRGREEAAAKERPRLIQFVIACWAELQRVQWPNRQALTTLTGVVLGFVLIAGGYLGLLDAIFSRIIQAIL